MIKNLVAIGWLVLATVAGGQTAAQSQLVSAEGVVELLKTGASEWQPGANGAALQVGDRVRTGPKSRAAVRLADASVLRIGELTTFHLLPPKAANEKPLIDVKSGSLYFFSRQKPDEVKFRTPTVSGAIRGTEFVVNVKESGLTEVALLDGKVLLEADGAQTELASGERAVAEAGKPIQKAPLLNAKNVIQWVLYYPAVVAPRDLNLTDMERNSAADSLAAYESGDLNKAAASLQLPPNPSNNLLLYAAALDLAAGNVSSAREKISRAPDQPVAQALSTLIRAVLFEDADNEPAGDSASEQLAHSYWLQSRGRLSEALAAARNAAGKAPQFGFAIGRVAELQFAHGNNSEALRLLARALELSPANAHLYALRGYSLAAGGKHKAAIEAFDEAIRRDSALGTARLGRGIAQQQLGALTQARQDFETAAALEPQRAVYRAYLARAFAEEKNFALAEKDFRLAKQLDPNDPTPWFYSGVANYHRNQVNDAIRGVQTAIDLNDNRQIYRSEFLLDQDRAARQANLAAIYRDASMLPLGVLEASRSVTFDYANYSSHRYLAQSYDLLSDRKKFSLRNEATRLSELYMTSLLSPVEGFHLSQNLGNQDSGRLFQNSPFGLSTVTEYFSDNEWLQTASQYGTFGSTAYSLDLIYRSIDNGDHPNNNLERRTMSAQVKQRITAQDSIFFQALHLDADSGDVQELMDPAGANLDLRVGEEHAPDLFLGYHREWSPGNHTLFLAGRLDSDLHIEDPTSGSRFFRRNGAGTLTTIGNAGLLNRDFSRDYEAYSGELQQVVQQAKQTFIFGGRAQQGDVETRSTLLNPFGNAVAAQRIETDFYRLSAYGYYQRELIESLHLTAGLSYDYLHTPRNADTSPVTESEVTNDQLSPKLGLLYSPWTNGTVRAAFTRSLGGFSYENSIRLEPTQIAGFNQTYRSIMPENIVGTLSGEEFQTISVGYDHSFYNRTFLLVEVENLRSEANRYLGALTNSRIPPAPDTPFTARQDLDYEENTLRAHIYHLLGEYFTLGGNYRYSRAAVDSRYHGVPDALAGASEWQRAELHQAGASVAFNHSSGFFALAESDLYAQQNRALADDTFWQHNLYVGYRFFKRAAELRLGVLNISDQDYRLNPLNLYADLPRDRTFTARLRLNF